MSNEMSTADAKKPTSLSATPKTKPGEPSPLLKLALELGPLLLFFFANARGADLIERYSFLSGFKEPIFLATAVFMVAISVSLTLSWMLTRTLAVMPIVTGVVVLVFGGLTLFLQDDLFIKLKPTIVNMLFATVLLGGLLFGKSLLGYVFDSVFRLTDEGWKKLTFRWGVFFVFLAILNEVVWRTQSTDFWVGFKVWGVMPITMLFTLSQLPTITRYTIADESEAEEAKAGASD